jgi:MoaA/NifB/PqqE/SkfB family radical SAM enzyme/SAM-dependent methyltransferase
MKGDAFLQSVAALAPFNRMHPQVAAFFRDYLAGEKTVPFGGRTVLSTHFPPYPSRAFDRMVEQFNRIGDARERSLFSVTLAVTNRCRYRCWHCYNAGRSARDLPLPRLRELARQLQDLGAVKVTISGGEPLLRGDLEEIIASFDDRTSLVLNTTGDGLTRGRAEALEQAGLFAAGVSLDSPDPDEHDRLRGWPGAFRTALQAAHAAAEGGLYPYVIALATRELLERPRFGSLMALARDNGALEVHLLEPIPAGRSAGRADVLLREDERRRILDYQREIAADESMPILSTLAYLESAEFFGCGAGLTHLYVDGSGEVCPCNLVPLSFGNVEREPLQDILDRMGRFFQMPRPTCVARVLAAHVGTGPLPTPPDVSCGICERHLPREHGRPRFFRVREAQQEVGAAELRSAYDRIHGDYDEFWLTQAGGPIDDLIARLPLSGAERVFDAGCGTGYGTVRLAARLKAPAQVLAADLSEGMLARARRRAASRGMEGIRFVAGDALDLLRSEGAFDLVFSSWALGYIPLKPFFAAASASLSGGGLLAFVVHRENSPRRPLEVLSRMVAEDPSVLERRVAFDFPRDADHVAQQVGAAGLRLEAAWEGKISFPCGMPEGIVEHLLKSGAGTAYHDAVVPARRGQLMAEFVRRLREAGGPYDVVHEYVSCIARKPQV